ncbi:C39 family peptidase [Microbacterium sp. NPDC057659]|uniref:C39 family peptidase n=1 Tax=Microbacterium sp. NPDC057659 TaxID=3346198 RepID=UPI00366BCA20
MKFRHLISVGAIAVLMAGLLAPVASASAGDDDTHQKMITSTHWDSRRDFAHGTSDGVRPAPHSGVTLPPSRSHRLPTLTYVDPFGDGAERTYEYGTWTSPVVVPGYSIDEAIVSWNATTPTGTWVESSFRGRLTDGTWTKWYVMGRWTSGADFGKGDIHRTSVDGQGDEHANIWTDTFSARTGQEPEAFQTRVRLLRPEGSRARPSVEAVTTLTNEYLEGSDDVTSAFTLGKQVELDVPPYAQNIHSGEYPEFGGGGEVWCSPTSTAMVQYYWGKRVPTRELATIEGVPQDPQVAYAAIHAWDYTYEGAGNWPFNAAYAHRFGLDSFVTRLRSLAEAERFIARGIPVIVSLSWDLEEMPEAGYDTDGHLMVIVGFTAEGDPILNDPAANSNENVRSIYTRENFEKVWQNSTNGIAYIYTPQGKRLPDNVEGVTPNW